MYRILLLVLTFLTVSYSFECLHHTCSAAFKACNIDHNSRDCWNWADEHFHCCNECEKCDTPSKEIEKEATNWEDECHPELCDAVFDVCNRLHPNSSECTSRADKASHCCYLCLSCPAVERAQFSKMHSYLQDKEKEKGDHHHKCDVDLCNSVYEHCTSNNHNHSSTYCQRVADHASYCHGKCKDKSVAKSEEKECHPKICNAVFDLCTHHSNSSDCQYKADEASSCCYDCLDCPSGYERPSRPKYDHCLSNLCQEVYDFCVGTEHEPDECRVVADKVSDCCTTIGNVCMDCH